MLSSLCVATPVQSLDATPAAWLDVGPDGAHCFDGSPWRFHYRPGDPARLAIWFDGGGICWNAATCDVERRTATAGAARPLPARGLFDARREDNPLRDFTLVVLPLCTGDAHLGNRAAEYRRADGTTFAFDHHGRVNTLAALDWLTLRGTTPQQVFVGGEGAGAIGAAFWATEVGDRWPNATLAVLGGAAGGFRSLGTNTALAQWGALERLPDVPAFAERDRVFFESFYIAAAQRHPSAALAQLNSADDAVQRRLMTSLGTPVAQLTKPLTCNLNEVRRDAPGFHSFIYPGNRHAILTTDALYSTRCGGTRLIDWIDDVVSLRTVENHWCEDAAASLANRTPPSLN